MANHGRVSTRENMSAEQVAGVLADLNVTLFKSNLAIDYCLSTAEKKPTWILRYFSGGTEWASRACWLQSRRHFEMRHGGGVFAWWIDTAILNEIAVRFSGTITDDSDDDEWPGEPGAFNTLAAYLRGVTRNDAPGAAAHRRYVVQTQVPEEFRQAALEAFAVT